MFIKPSGPPFPTMPKSGRNDVHLIVSQVDLEIIKWQLRIGEDDY